MKSYDPSRPITATNWPSDLKMPPLRSGVSKKIEPKPEPKPETRSPWWV